ncbi:predicted protein [Histoplasma capsulatum var. duboisii H88]|uniref:Predicted protein n=2 Tax=Ajellomyces capsulatus TaxID=5037 RepID=F0UHM1_AJEC8|nr:predicted protein [Histoplasma capsulatum H143]EGC45432.1 predicted protein [Histoplasma capsulatum var. duboisii H88]
MSRLQGILVLRSMLHDRRAEQVRSVLRRSAGLTVSFNEQLSTTALLRRRTALYESAIWNVSRQVERQIEAATGNDLENKSIHWFANYHVSDLLSDPDYYLYYKERELVAGVPFFAIEIKSTVS